MEDLPQAVAEVVGDEPLAPRQTAAERAGEAEAAWPGTIRSGPRHWVWHAGAGAGAGAGDQGVAAEEARRLDWLAPRLACPTPLWSGGPWLLTTAPTGHPADEPERQPRPDDVPGLIGAALRQLHDLPVADCPFERSWHLDVEQLAAAVDSGRLERSRLPTPYDRYEPRRLLELLGPAPSSNTASTSNTNTNTASNTTSNTASDDGAGAGAGVGDGPVVCHGNPVVANWWFDQGSLTATVGVHRLGLADRHLDLAVAYRSLQLHFGPESAYGFIEGYGRDPDLLRLDRHIMLDVLREAAALPRGVAG